MVPDDDNNHNISWDLILYILLLAFVLIFQPFIYFVCGWITGWIISLVFGNIFINGLALLGITIEISNIPLLCGILGVIGSFFKDGFGLEETEDEN